MEHGNGGGLYSSKVSTFPGGTPKKIFQNSAPVSTTASLATPPLPGRISPPRSSFDNSKYMNDSLIDEITSLRAQVMQSIYCFGDFFLSSFLFPLRLIHQSLNLNVIYNLPVLLKTLGALEHQGFWSLGKRCRVNVMLEHSKMCVLKGNI